MPPPSVQPQAPYLPPAPPPPPPPPPPPARHVEHQVERGETLTEISARYQTTVEQLTDANPEIEDPNQIDVGQTLSIPIGDGYGVEPVAVQVEAGDTLSGLAAEYQQPLSSVVQANRHELRSPDLIHVGQEIWIPGTRAAAPAPAPEAPPAVDATPSPATPPAAEPATPQVDAAPPAAPAPAPSAEAQATDRAVQGLLSAQNTYDEINAQTQSSGSALPYLAENVAQARQGLNDAVAAELHAQTGAAPGTYPGDDELQSARDAIVGRYDGSDPAAQAAQAAVSEAADAAVTAVRTDREVDRIVTQAQGEADPQARLEALNQGYAGADAATQAQLLDDTGARAIIEAVAAHATEPLRTGVPDAVGPQAPGREFAGRLDAATQSLAPELAARVIEAAAPELDAYLQDYQANYGGQPFGPQGFAHLVTLLGRVADTAAGQAQIDKLARQGLWDNGGAHQALAEGANPAYLIALAQQPGIDSVRVLEPVYGRIGTLQGDIERTVGEYAEEMEELGWLVNNHGGSMTADQLEAAIAQYKTEKGPEWEARLQGLNDKLAEQGEQLLLQLTALDALPPDLGDSSRITQDVVQRIADNPAAQIAIRTALQGGSDLLAGGLGDKALSFFAENAAVFKGTDQGRKFINELATLYMRQTVLERIGTLDAADPASVQRARDALAELGDSRFAALLGLSQKDLDKSIRALEATLPQAGDTAEDVAARLARLDETIEGIKGLDKTTFAGQLLRGVGLALAGTGFLASAARAIDDPTLKNNLKLIVDAAGLGQKGTELLIGLGRVDADSALGRLGSSAAGKFLGVLGAGFDFWSAGESFASGDVPAGLLYATGGVGGVMAALGAGSLAGPIGIGLVIISVVGLTLWSNTKEANKHEPGSDGGVSLRFLQHAGFSEDAARALVDQSGEGHSPVPLLQQYAQLKGLDLADAADQQRFVDWINGMDPAALARLRDRLHATLDHVDGDVSKFTATSDLDSSLVVPPEYQSPSWSAPNEYELLAQIIRERPTSVVQLDAALAELGLPALP